MENITVSNCITTVAIVGDGATIGFETDHEYVKNVTVRDCDFLESKGGGGTGGHSGFSIVCSGTAWITDTRFENIRVEENQVKNLELIVLGWAKGTNNPPGHIKDVYLKNIVWDNPDKPVILKSESAGHLVEDVTFDNCYVGGKLLRSLKTLNRGNRNPGIGAAVKEMKKFRRAGRGRDACCYNRQHSEPGVVPGNSKWEIPVGVVPGRSKWEIPG